MIKNPFKFGSIVDDPYFTNRTEEIKREENIMETIKLLEKKKNIEWDYDAEADVLYIFYDKPQKAEGIKHEKINARKKQYVKDKIYHVQNTNQTARALKDWMAGFNGVATKYLQNYLSWFMVLEQIKGKIDKTREFAIAALISTNAWF